MIKQKKNKNQKIHRRLFLFGLFKVSAISFILERLYNLQIKQLDKYKKLAENNRINLMFILPSRGLILDRNNKILAENKKQYQLIYRLNNSAGELKHLKKLFKYIDLEELEKLNLINNLINKKNLFSEIIIKSNLSWAEVARVSANITELRGVSIETRLVRSYKSIPSSHVLGYVTKPDKLNYPKLAKVSGTVVGKIGIEKSFDKELQGKFGIKKEEVNAHGRVVNEISRVDGISGKDIQLSISRDLQGFCYDRLGENTGSIVAMNVQNGEILSFVSKPSFDSNDFSNNLSQDKWNNIIKNELKPMFNRASTGTYPPGSIFKLIVSLAALNDKEFNPNKKYFCNGGYKFGNQIFHCWKKEGHGFINCEEAISMSCDCYFYDISLKVGIEKISEIAVIFGLGKEYLKSTFSSSKGIIPNKVWKKNHFNTAWTKSDTIVAAIGQGYTLSTPLQLAVMTSRIATEGRMVIPSILKNTTIKKDFPKNSVIDKKAYKLIKSGMFKTVNFAKGTAYGSRLFNTNAYMCGKTATSQVRRISMAEREKGIKKNEELPREQRDHALFAGYYPHNKPKYAFSIIVEHGGSGSKSAAPIAKDLCKQLTKNL